jgi:hypothetical protein
MHNLFKFKGEIVKFYDALFSIVNSTLYITVVQQSLFCTSYCIAN